MCEYVFLILIFFFLLSEEAAAVYVSTVFFFFFVRWKTARGTKSNYLLRLMATINIFFFLRNNEMGFNEKSYVEYSLMLYNTCYTCKTKNIYNTNLPSVSFWNGVSGLENLFSVLFLFVLSRNCGTVYIYQSLTPRSRGYTYLVSQQTQANRWKNLLK